MQHTTNQKIPFYILAAFLYRNLTPQILLTDSNGRRSRPSRAYEHLVEFIETKYFEKNGGVTWIGWVLKQIYMDELPQLYNVIVGEMSLIGPRPVNEQVFDKLMSSGIEHKRKVRAGITGNFQSYKQVEGKDANELDAEYVEYYLHKPWYSLLWFDIKIIIRTFKVIGKAKGI